MWHETLLSGTGETVRFWRAGQGQPLLYLHGVDGLRQNMPLLDLLARRHRVIAPVHPGFNGTPALQSATILSIAAFYRHVLHDLGVGAPAVVGHCLGGMLAAELAILVLPVTIPLILIAPLGLWSDEAPVADMLSLEGPEWRHRGWACADTLENMPPAPREGDSRSAAAAAAWLWPIPDRGLRDRLARLRQRTLLIWGRQDGLVPPALAGEFAALIPDAATCFLDRCGHYPTDEQAVRLIDHIERFVAECGRLTSVADHPPQGIPS